MIFDLNQSVFGGPGVLDLGRPGVQLIHIPIRAQAGVQSVVIDVDSNQGDSDYVGIRRVLFYLAGVVLQIIQAHYTAYATSKFSDDFDPKYIFDESLSRIGAASTKSWKSAAIVGDKKQRVSCVFNTPQKFDKISIENYHDSGSSVTTGVQAVKVYTSADAITSIVHGAGFTSSKKILEATVPAHVAEDTVDEQVETLKPVVIAPENSVAPEISGTFEDGEILSCTTGTWTGTSPAYTYQWKSDDVAITGETSSTYTLTEDDLEAEITCLVTATNSAGSDSQVSNALSRTSTYTAKSVILDIADNWGGSEIMLRQIDFYLNNEKIGLTPDDYTANATVWAYSGLQYHPNNVFDTESSKTGGVAYYVQWATGSYGTNPCRILVVFDDEITFNRVDITNGHWGGEGTSCGAKNVKMYGSTDSVTSTTYNADVPNSTLIFDGQLTKHDPFDIDHANIIINGELDANINVGIKQLIVEATSNWGGSEMWLRRIEFYKDDELVEIDDSDYAAFGTQIDARFAVENALDTSLSLTGSYSGNLWGPRTGVGGIRGVWSFKTPIDFDSIVAYNGHTSGVASDHGFKDIKIWQSWEPDTSSSTFDDDLPSDAELIFEGQLAQHSATDEADPQTLELI